MEGSRGPKREPTFFTYMLCTSPYIIRSFTYAVSVLAEILNVGSTSHILLIRKLKLRKI